MPSPRRLFLIVLSIPVLFLLFLYLGSLLTSPDVFVTTRTVNPDEIFGLLHFVTSPDEADRVVITSWDTLPDSEVAIAPDRPVALTWYARGSIAKTGERASARWKANGWEERLEVLQEKYPLVVFSKSYCPYSKRAKQLLESYDLSPAPKIIEVDMRADGSHIKTLLTRLTHRTTFPNVILNGHSLGGSDELVQLHEAGRLRQALEHGGIRVGWA